MTPRGAPLARVADAPGLTPGRTDDAAALSGVRQHAGVVADSYETRRPASAGPADPQVAALLHRLALTLLALLVLWSATHVGEPQFRGKGMAVRLTCTPMAAAALPLGWWLTRNRRRHAGGFPHVPALLVTLPLVIDLAGNAAGLYRQVEYFDDAVHVVNPLLLVAAAAMLLDRSTVPRWATWVMAFGLGCAGNIAWELVEYQMMMQLGAVELRLSLADTLSDQAWGLLGALAGATLPLLTSPRAAEGAPSARAAGQTMLPARLS